MQNLRQNLDKALLFSTLTSSNYQRIQYFFQKLCTRFLLTNVYKSVFGIFLFCLDRELFAKIKKIPGFYTIVSYIFINNSRSKQNKKNPEHPLVDIVSRKHVQNLSKNFMIVGVHQSLQFFRQITWFLGNNSDLPKFKYQILHNLISIIKLEKNQSVKANFKLTTRATLNKLFNNCIKLFWYWISFFTNMKGRSI